MKRSKLIVVTFATLLSQSLLSRPVNAQDSFKVLVNTIGVTTNQTGGLAIRTFGNREIIRRCAADQGVTNLADLSLVYNRAADALQVVSGTNQTVICTPLTFANGSSVSNAQGTRIERLSFVYVETNTVADGTLVASERLKFGSSNQLTGFQLVGRLQFAIDADGTNGTAIYSGMLIANPGFICQPHGHGKFGKPGMPHGH